MFGAYRPCSAAGLTPRKEPDLHPRTCRGNGPNRVLAGEVREGQAGRRSGDHLDCLQPTKVKNREEGLAAGRDVSACCSCCCIPTAFAGNASANKVNGDLWFTNASGPAHWVFNAQDLRQTGDKGSVFYQDADGSTSATSRTRWLRALRRPSPRRSRPARSTTRTRMTRSPGRSTTTAKASNGNRRRLFHHNSAVLGGVPTSRPAATHEGRVVKPQSATRRSRTAVRVGGVQTIVEVPDRAFAMLSGRLPRPTGVTGGRSGRSPTSSAAPAIHSAAGRPTSVVGEPVAHCWQSPTEPRADNCARTPLRNAVEWGPT